MEDELSMGDRGSKILQHALHHILCFASYRQANSLSHSRSQSLPIFSKSWISKAWSAFEIQLLGFWGARSAPQNPNFDLLSQDDRVKRLC
jgi:hypothetical protein